VRIAVLSDVHSNLAALEAVLADAEARRALDEVWSLGDLVGYGPQPCECLARLRQYRLRSVAGNHDLAATGAIDTSDFNPTAALANQWNAAQLGEGERAFLASLPLTIHTESMDLTHGSLREPVWEYMFTLEAAIEQFRRMQSPYSLVGHTHVPLVFSEARRGATPGYAQPEDGESLNLGKRRLIINPGGVGQPRDGDPRAAYAVLDDKAMTVTFHRVEYDVDRTRRLIADAGLPARLGDRLLEGH
jgi:diadenosine tetraphosphatase ApaH/serine/threonine PP2A family protein phosphatase